MREEFRSSYWKDFQQRYQSTFGWYEKEGGEKVLVQLSRVDESKITFLDKLGFKYQANADKGNFFTFLPAERGTYAVGDDIVVCKRVPARQWKRGICPENTSIQSLVHKVQLSVTFDTLEKMFTKGDNKPLETFKKTLRGNAVFNTNFSIVGGSVYLYENAIGTYDEGRRSITLSTPLFRQEVTDFVTKHQLPILVA